MTDRLTVLKQLRDRMAKATGPDYDLDAAILEFTKGAKVEKIDGFYGIRWPDGHVDPSGYMPKFTGSLDAASTLVPDGAWKEVSGPRRYLNIPSPSPNYWHCAISVWKPFGLAGTSSTDAHGWGATEPLSIVDARLAYEIARAEAAK